MRYNPKVFKHKKSGKLYWRLADAEFKNWSISGKSTDCVVYCPCDDENSIYVRYVEDWNMAFEEVQE